MKLSELLKTAVDSDAADLFLIPKRPPMMRVNEEMIPIVDTPLTQLEIQQVAEFMMSEKQRAELEQNSELNFAYEREETGRFRVNIFKSHSGVSMVCRIVKMEIPTIDQLLLPPVLRELVLEDRGLVLVTGAVASGKSSTLAALIDHRNNVRTGHILTAEDPLEFLHVHKQSLVSQREIGIDTESYTIALKNMLRQSPDVIMIGEIRDAETMSHALHFAETGHLLLSTLHATNTYQALERIMNFYPIEFRSNILLQLSMNLKAIVSQRLLPRIDGNGLIVAVGVMRDTPRIKDLIAKGEIGPIADTIEERNRDGMRSVDQAIFSLYEQGTITEEDALRYSDSPNNVGLKIRQLENTRRQQQESEKLKQARESFSSSRYG
ncbi:PilT/PilU family type 4a pilus ATPase [Candidatus Poribacteria bacterium]